MNRRLTKFSLRPGKVAACAGLTACLLGTLSQAQTIPNPSFEANSFSVGPGYVADNAEIQGWTTDYSYGAGLSPAGGDTTFANNGTVPDGANVAFITGGTSLSTSITGLTAGETYKITLRVNAGTGQTPILRVSLDATEVLALTIYPVGETAPYQYLAFEFTAAADTAALSFFSDATSDQAVLIDDLEISGASGWSVTAWTDDASSGVDTQYVYSHAYNFGSAANPVVNGVPFTGVAGANPTVAGEFAATHFGNIYNNDVNTITGGGADMARDFIYSGANVEAGTYQAITIEGLTPGTDYVATIFSAGWEAPSTTARWATISMGEDRLTFNQDQFNNDNGIRLSHRYTAGTNGTAVINIAPINPVNVSIHVYGFANREAESRNVAPIITVQPRSTVVAQGLPVEFTVGGGGFPVPTYQWRFNGTNIAGATSATNSITQATSATAGNYDVIVANSMGSVTSTVARLVVGLPMANSSFEEDAFVSWPGYSGDNPGNANTPPGPNIPITGWVQSSLENSGINPIATGEAPFADNGTIPHGRQVAFIQTLGETTNTLTQTVTGLTAGSQYYVHYYENSRAGTSQPALEVTLDGETAVPAHLVPSGGYREVYTDVFTAESSSVEITFVKSSPTGADTTVLIDNVAVVPVAPGTAPVVLTSPAAAAGNVAGSATFSAQVLGSLPFSYQWFRNGVAIAGATNGTLTLTDLALADAGDYTLQITNAGGSVTTSAARLTVNQPVAGLFNTGLDASGAPLADGDIDPHYQLAVNPHIESQDAIVQDSTIFPIVAGPWLANTESSKWIGPEINTVSGAVGLYTYRTTFDLTGRNPATVRIVGRWATDNVGRDILVNGVSIGTPESPGFNAYTPFEILGSETTMTAGTNTLDFIVDNVDAIGYTGLRVEFLESNALPAGTNGGDGPTMQISADGTALTITWAEPAAGQTLESAPTVEGPWSPVANATSPYTATATGEQMFFRVVQ